MEVPLLARGLTLKQVDQLKPIFYPQIFRTIFDGRSPSQMVVTSNDWHAVLANRGRTAAKGDEWLALTKVVKAPDDEGGLTLVPLTTEAQLTEEGSVERMDNCLSTYGHACMYEGSHIISLREGGEGGKSVADVELQAKGGGKYFEVFHTHEFKGYGNSPPSEEARLSLDWYIESINSGSVEVHPELLEIGQKQRQADYEKRRAALSLEDYQKLCDENFSKLTRFLPKKYRDMNFNEFMNESGLQVMVDSARLFLEEMGEDKESFAPAGELANRNRAVLDVYRHSPSTVTGNVKKLISPTF